VSYVVVGAGAIGGTVAARLLRDGRDVLLCDADAEHVAAINRDGLIVEGPVEEIRVAARAITPEELAAPVGRVILAVKAHHTATAADLISDRLAADGYVLSLQNGINAPVLCDRLGEQRVLCGLVNFGADVVAPGRILLGGKGAVRIGELNGRPSDRLSTLVGEIQGAVETANVTGCLWAKEAYGAMLFATAITDLAIADVLADRRFHPLLRSLAGEVLEAAPVPVEEFDGFDPADLDGSIRRMVDFNRRSAKTHSGVYRDLAVRHRPTEVDNLLEHVPGPLVQRLGELVHAIEQGSRTCRVENLELLATHERLERSGLPLNAVVTAIGAPERAADGALRGEPVAIKDNIDMAGIVTTNASLVGDAEPAAEDAEVVTRLRAAGAELFCKTNLLEHAAGSVSPAFGMTRNPHDPERTSGGSSGGSAALVAAGVCDLAIGTDSGGSIRIPAAYCGIVGLKPTYGLVSVAGTNPLSPSCDHVGTLTRTAAQAARLLAVVADVPSLPDAPSPRLAVLDRELDDPDLEPAVRARVLDGIERLRRLGFEVRSIDIPELAIADDTLGTVVVREAYDRHREWFAESASLYGPGTRALLELGAGIDDTAYRDARAAMARIAEAYERTFREVDLLAGPTACFVAPPEDPPFGTPEGSIEGRFTGPANLAGVPALSTPCGLAGGLPVGLQLTAARGHDAALLRAARAFEEATP